MDIQVKRPSTSNPACCVATSQCQDLGATLSIKHGGRERQVRGNDIKMHMKQDHKSIGTTKYSQNLIIKVKLVTKKSSMDILHMIINNARIKSLATEVAPVHATLT